MSYKGESPFAESGEIVSSSNGTVERQLERLCKERAILTEAWEQMYSRLQVVLGPARPQKGDLAADPTPEQSELSSRMADEAWQLSRISYGIRETMDRLEL